MALAISTLLSSIKAKNERIGISINPPATGRLIKSFEEKLGFELPADFREFYAVCNGFSCTDDIFNVLPLEEISVYQAASGMRWFDFAEYMTYSDMWTLRRTKSGVFEIINSGKTEVVLTSSLADFLQRFLNGNVFETGGLYDWHAEKIQAQANRR